MTKILESNTPLFFGNMQQFDLYNELIKLCLETIKKSDNVRLIVIETWGLLDYLIRDIIVSGYGLEGFCQNDFDVRYLLLTHSHAELLNILKETIDYQKTIQENKHIRRNVKDLRPHYKFTACADFYKYLELNAPDILNRLKTLDNQFHNEKYPDDIKIDDSFVSTIIYPDDENVGIVPDGWLDELGKISDVWFNQAKQLNKARNKAAHYAKPSDIAKAFGINGNNFNDSVKAKCYEILNALLGIDEKAFN